MTTTAQIELLARALWATGADLDDVWENDSQQLRDLYMGESAAILTQLGPLDPLGAVAMREKAAKICRGVSNRSSQEIEAIPLPTHADCLAQALAMPEIARLVEAAQWARNLLNIIADESWHGDGRDLKRSIVGIFADFDEALMGVDSSMPPALAALTPTIGETKGAA